MRYEIMHAGFSAEGEKTQKRGVWHFGQYSVSERSLEHQVWRQTDSLSRILLRFWVIEVLPHVSWSFLFLLFFLSFFLSHLAPKGPLLIFLRRLCAYAQEGRGMTAALQKRGGGLRTMFNRLCFPVCSKQKRRISLTASYQLSVSSV